MDQGHVYLELCVFRKINLFLLRATTLSQWDHHTREEGWSIITAFPVDLGDVGSVFCCDRLSL